MCLSQARFNRDEGLRAPHKLTMAVPGCTRDREDLFAMGLDDETLIQTIDRFLIFYIRTADRSQRTSVWMENMESGLKYLR